MRCFLIGFAGFIIAGFAAMVSISSYGDYAARASVTATIGAAEPLRSRIEEMLKQKGAGTNAGAPPPLAPPKDAAVAGADYLKIAADGTIILRSAKHGQIVAFEPTLRDNAVTWKCIASKPDKDIPFNCR